jgi:hypothetical protein
MKTILFLVGAFVWIAAAHSETQEDHVGIPKLVGGRRLISDLKVRNALPARLKDLAAYFRDRNRGSRILP